MRLADEDIVRLLISYLKSKRLIGAMVALEDETGPRPVNEASHPRVAQTWAHEILTMLKDRALKRAPRVSCAGIQSPALAAEATIFFRASLCEYPEPTQTNSGSSLCRNRRGRSWKGAWVSAHACAQG